VQKGTSVGIHTIGIQKCMTFCQFIDAILN